MSKQQTTRRRKRYNPGSAYAGRVRPRGVFALFGNLKLFYFVGAAIMLGSLAIGGLFGSNLFAGGGAHGAGGSTSDSQDFVLPEDDADSPVDDANAVTSPEQPSRLYAAPPPLTIDPSERYLATIRTEKGDFSVELFTGRAPNTVNFVFLAQDGFYNGLPFHFVSRGFSAQAGDPTGTSGGPGYELPQEAPAPFERGFVGMANAGQFFIALTSSEQFEGYTPFGRVIMGLDVAERLRAGDGIRSVDVTEAAAAGSEPGAADDPL